MPGTSGGASLGLRIIFLMVAAVLPLAALGASFAWISGETAYTAEMQTRYETARVFASQVETVVEGVSRVTAYSVQLASIDEPDGCAIMVEEMLRSMPAVRSAELVLAGTSICAREREAGEIVPPAGLPGPAPPRTLNRVVLGSDGAPVLQVVESRTTTLDPVLVVEIALDPVWERLAAIDGYSEPDVFLLTDAGDVVANPRGTPQGTRLDAVAAALTASKASGPVIPVENPDVGYVAFADIGQTTLRLAVTSPNGPLGRADASRLVIVVLLPLLFLAAAVATAWFGVDRLVNRWIRRMRRTSALYGAGRLSARVGAIEQAPVEFRSLASAFDDMAASVEARSHELERALAEREHFLRELHHRIKNNFQMIASLLSLQRREVAQPVVSAIREAHDRVQALAAAYRVSYADADTNSVPIQALVADLMERLRESAGASRSILRLVDATDGAILHLDRAIPLALLTTELVAPLLDVAGAAADPLVLTTRLVDHGATLHLELTWPEGLAKPASRGRLSDRLISAYVGQLSATLERVNGRLTIALPFFAGASASPEAAAPPRPPVTA